MTSCVMIVNAFLMHFKCANLLLNGFTNIMNNNIPKSQIVSKPRKKNTCIVCIIF